MAMIVSLKQLVARLNETTYTALEQAAALCMSRTNYEIELPHLLVKLLEVPDGDFSLLVLHFGIDRQYLLMELEQSLDRIKKGNSRSPAFSPQLIDTLTQGWLFGSLDQNASKIRSGFLIVALLADETLSKCVLDFSREMLKIDVKELRQGFERVLSKSKEQSVDPPPNPPGASRAHAPKVFLSCRPNDGALYADYLSARLRADVPNLLIFQNSDVLQPGVVRRERILETILACSSVLAIIGRNWLNDDLANVQSANDSVSLEIATALEHNKLVIPCLIDGANLPSEKDLPLELAGLALRQPVVLSEETLKSDTEALVQLFRNWKPKAN